MTIKTSKENTSYSQYKSYENQVLAIVEKHTALVKQKGQNLVNKFDDEASRDWVRRHQYPFLERSSIHLLFDHLNIFPLNGWDGIDLSKAINTLVMQGKLVKIKHKNKVRLHLPEYAPPSAFDVA